MTIIAPQALARKAVRGIYLLFEGVASAVVAVLVVLTWFISATWTSSRN